jgi:pyrimidine oxygenase
MEIGVFIPIGNNGWLISSTSPQYTPSFDLNREVVLRAEKYGFDFALSMIKLRGFGGPSRCWDDNLESLTLMAGLASITTRIELMATVAVLTLPPALCARKAMTIDSISHGRFGVNLVTGWQKAEYDQMGLWPGDDRYKYRYDLLTEYATIMQELWGTGRSDLKGKHYTMNDCRLGPLPSRQIPLAQEPRVLYGEVERVFGSVKRTTRAHCLNF